MADRQQGSKASYAARPVLTASVPAAAGLDMGFSGKVLDFYVLFSAFLVVLAAILAGPIKDISW